ncbi:MAG: hypothetical protein HYZ23_04435 [Chloroflexi bacterium]|nr:hypothetical protein [Chloroflexota bacterium]
MDKLTFLNRLFNERDKFENLVNRVGFARQLTMTGVWGNLSIKDLLADTLTREQFIADRLNEVLHGETHAPCASHTSLENFCRLNDYPDYESPLVKTEERNRLAIDKYKNISLDDIIEQELAAFASIIAALEKLSHNQCLDHDLFHRIAEQTYKPYRRVSAEIHRWLKSIESEAK